MTMKDFWKHEQPKNRNTVLLFGGIEDDDTFPAKIVRNKEGAQ